MLALQGSVIPDRYVTVFAGVDRDAVNRAREYMADYPPWSPAMGLFRDGKQVFMLQRSDLQQMADHQVASALKKAFEEHCAKAGPSVDPEKFRQLQPYQGCGTHIRWWTRDPDSRVGRLRDAVRAFGYAGTVRTPACPLPPPR